MVVIFQGLDPAGPLFEGHPKLYVLDQSDAKYVDVIHTSGALNINNDNYRNLGYSQPMGHVDYYPNGGVYLQPGCGKMLYDFPCSHLRGRMLFAAAIRSNNGPLLAYQCTDYTTYTAGDCFTKGEHESVQVMEKHMALFPPPVSIRYQSSNTSMESIKVFLVTTKYDSDLLGKIIKLKTNRMVMSLLLIQ